jgi:(S)-ureidoglycine aminohydrolase
LKNLGVTRSCYKPNHLLQTPDTFVRAPLPGMVRATAIVHAAPAIGAGFTQYTAEMEPGGALASEGDQRFVFVLDGELRVECVGRQEEMLPGSYCYLPPDTAHQLSAGETCRFILIEKRYQAMAAAEAPGFFIARSQAIVETPLMGDADVRVQTLIPEIAAFDFAVNLMTFEPGASLALTEIHFMQHGLLMLDGGGIYRLGDCWHPVTAGDFIWMAPYCPQWFGAIGKRPARYLIYKDWNRAPDFLP